MDSENKANGKLPLQASCSTDALICRWVAGYALVSRSSCRPQRCTRSDWLCLVEQIEKRERNRIVLAGSKNTQLRLKKTDTTLLCKIHTPEVPFITFDKPKVANSNDVQETCHNIIDDGSGMRVLGRICIGEESVAKKIYEYFLKSNRGGWQNYS